MTKKLNLVKTSVFLSIMVLCAANAYTQTFTITEDTMYRACESNGYFDVGIGIEKLDSSTDLVLKWETLRNELPKEWDISLCDYPNCYLGVPNSGTMDTLKGNQKAFMKISFNPLDKEARGIAQFYVFDEKLPNDGDTLTFIIDAGLVGILNRNTSQIDLGPNPMLDVLRISNQLNSEVKIFDLLGKEIYSRILDSDHARIDVSNLAKGSYYLSVKTQNQNISLQKLIKH